MGNRNRLLRRVKVRRQREREQSEERLAERLGQHWADMRSGRKGTESEPVIVSGPSNFSQAQVPWGFDLAAAWAWRFLVVAAALFALLWVLAYFAVIVLPLIIALLATALALPLVRVGVDLGIGRRISSLIIVVLGLGLIALLLTFVGQQVANGIDDLSKQVVGGLGEIRHWVRTGPLHASDSQVNDFIKNMQETISSSNGQVVTRATELTTAVGHIVAGAFIILFATYFFLADGPLIWSWFVRLFPRAARLHADTSGRVAWRSLTQFVRATVLVALTDAIGIMIVAAVLKVPFVMAIGVLVFLGAFVPMVGAATSGTVAVLVALVDQGLVVALIMLAGVVVVQQIEAHILQPFLMGRFVSVHPLGVIVAIGCGVLVGGIAGALIAVPFAAALNAVVQHLATYRPPPEEPPGEPARDDGPLEDPVLG